MWWEGRNPAAERRRCGNLLNLVLVYIYVEEPRNEYIIIMLHLRTLGALDLRDSRGERLAAVLARAKQVALLSYLAIEEPGRSHRRDTLLALFWPDADSEHAQTSLRQALYQLRMDLGSEVLKSRGDEVSLDEGQVWCDAAAFDAAVGERRLDEALALYRGELLKGFHLSGTPEFEQWLDTARRRLGQAAADAALSLAREAEAAGREVEARRNARRAAALGPYDELACRNLIGLLDRLGDRAGAVIAFERFAERLRSELDMEPSPELRSAIERIRARQEVGEHFPTRQLPPTAARRIAVLPMKAPGNISETEPSEVAFARELGNAFAEQLVAALASVEDFHVVPTRSVRPYLSGKGGVRGLVDKLGATLLVNGTITRTPEGVRLAVELIDAEADDVIWAKSFRGTLEDVRSTDSPLFRSMVQAIQAAVTRWSPPSAPPGD